MKKNTNKYNWPILLVIATLFLTTGSYAQGKKVKLKTVTSFIVDENGTPIEGAIIHAKAGSIIATSDAEGNFSISTPPSGDILIESTGYADYIWNLAKNPVLQQITLTPELLLTSSDDKVILPFNIEVDQRNLVGAVSTIKGNELELYNDPLLSNTLQGMASGLNVIMQSGGMANNSATIYVRGLSRNSSNSPIYLVDGVERDIDDINPEEIENFEVLKDATAKILYGARAANGVLLITTKRGEAHKRIIDTKVDFGVGLTTFTPEFLDSYDYATLYNEARTNDGLTPVYSDKDLEGYKNSTGENDLLSPNVDYYDYFMRNYTTFQKVTTQVSGGNDNAQYAFMAGYMGYQGLQDVGDRPTQDRFNIRANLDVNVNEFINAYINMSAIIDSWEYSGLDHSSTYSALSSHRPNEYPLIIGEEYIATTNKGVPALGASDVYSSNLLGSLMYSGNGNDQFINQQMTAGLDFNLDMITEGLTAKTFIAFDNFFYGQQKIQPAPATYVVSENPYGTATGGDAILFRKVQDISNDTYYNLTNNSTLRTTAVNGLLDYDKTFESGVLDATLGYYYYLNEAKGSSQDVKNDNLYLRSNYVHNSKYIAELNLALMGSNRFIESKQHFLSYAVGAAWIISEEDFMPNNTFDYLKLKASYGLMGYDAATSHFLYENRWQSTGKAQFGEQDNGTDVTRTLLSTWGNPDLEWEKSREINVGIEGITLNHHLSFEANYYNEFRYDMIGIESENYSSMVGNFKYNTNFAEVSNSGVELSINYQNNVGNLHYSVGTNYTYSKNKNVTKDEVAYPESRTTEGLPTDVIMGYESLGLFGKDVDLASAPHQNFGDYGVGDIAYKDQNGDNIIDDLDKVVIGNSVPRSILGLDVNLKYKNWGFYALFTGSFGVSKQLTSTYYYNYGNLKYSVLANDAYHPVRNEQGDQPMLTTGTADNNTVTSDFWTTDANFVRLKNVELSYTLDLNPQSVVKQSKFYIRANNLFAFSNIDDVDPEAPTAGITNYPVLRMITGGVAISF